MSNPTDLESVEAPPMAESDHELQQQNEAEINKQDHPSSFSSDVRKKSSNISFSIWPPSSRTRDAVKSRLIDILSSASILTKRYGTLPREEACTVAVQVEQDSFVAACNATDSNPSEDGIEVLECYSKEISKRMLEFLKSRSVSSSASTPDHSASFQAPPDISADATEEISSIEAE